MDDITKKMSNIHLKDPSFYELVQDEIESDLARMEKTVEDAVRIVRMTVAEMEVAHMELRSAMVDLKKTLEENNITDTPMEN